MNSLNQIRYELRKQPLLTWTSILGTALSIFMIMAIYIAFSIPTIPIAPENNRSRMMLGKYIHLTFEDGRGGSGSFAYNIGKKLYSGLDGVEHVSFADPYLWNAPTSLPGKETAQLPIRSVDSEFWNIMNFDFIYGKPLPKTDTKTKTRITVITKATAERFFGDQNPVGKEININHIPYRIIGVVEGANPLLSNSYAELYVPYTQEADGDIWMQYFGNTYVILLKKPGVSSDYIRDQVKARYASLNSMLKKQQATVTYHNAPFDLDNTTEWSNAEPSNSDKLICYFLYVILLLLPAINLNAMTRSRLRSRVSEIGINRAFGASRLQIIRKLLIENMVLTLIGGLLGLIFCAIFMSTISDLFFSWGSIIDTLPLDTTPTFGMIFNWKVFIFSFAGCIVLNLLSIGIPAFKASRLNPAEAIHGTSR